LNWFNIIQFIIWASDTFKGFCGMKCCVMHIIITFIIRNRTFFEALSYWPFPRCFFPSRHRLRYTSRRHFATP
jgi:hypothetical protein